MNKHQLVAQVSARADISKRAAADALDALADSVVRAVAAGDRVTLPGLGSFERRHRAPRTARNPRTGDAVSVPATHVPVFRAAGAFRRAVAGRGKRAKL